MPFSTKQKYMILIAISTSSFLTTFTASALNIALPSIANELDVPYSDLQYVISAYLIVNATMLVPFGKLADIFGRKIFFMVGLVLFLIAHLIAVFSMNEWWLIACRGFAGFAASMFFSNNIAILSSVFPKEERGKALGTSVSIAYMGITVGPFVGGMITSYWSWRGIFISIIPIIAISILMSYKQIPNDLRKGSWSEFDFKSALLYIPALILAVVGITQLPSIFGAILTLLGFTLLVLFCIVDINAKNPFMGIRYFIKNKLFIYSNIANFIQYFSTSAVTFMVSLFLQNKEILGLGAKAAGIVLLAQPILQLIVSPVAGVLSDRVEARYIAAFGMGLSALSLLGLALQGPDTTIIIIVVLLLMMGAGLGFFTSPNNNLIMSSIDPKVYGIGSGILSTGRILGMSLSIATTAIVFNVFESDETNLASFLFSFRTVFLIFFVASIAGALVSLIRARPSFSSTKSGE